MGNKGGVLVTGLANDTHLLVARFLLLCLFLFLFLLLLPNFTFV
jgi:hypothetical protein